MVHLTDSPFPLPPPPPNAFHGKIEAHPLFSLSFLFTLHCSVSALGFQNHISMRFRLTAPSPPPCPAICA